MYRLTFTLLLVASLQGCGRVAYPQAATPVPVRTTADLNGIYQNTPADSSYSGQCLWSVLTRRPGRKTATGGRFLPGNSIKFTAVGRKKIIAILYNDSTLLDQRKLKGKVTDGSFRKNSRTRSVGVPFIYWRLSHYGMRFRTDSTGQLLVDVADSNGGMVFIISGGSTVFTTVSFERK